MDSNKKYKIFHNFKSLELAKSKSQLFAWNIVLTQSRPEQEKTITYLAYLWLSHLQPVITTGSWETVNQILHQGSSDSLEHFVYRGALGFWDCQVAHSSLRTCSRHSKSGQNIWRYPPIPRYHGKLQYSLTHCTCNWRNVSIWRSALRVKLSAVLSGPHAT